MHRLSLPLAGGAGRHHLRKPAPASSPPASRPAAARGELRRLVQARIARLGPLGDRAQRHDELVERRFALALGRLDQHRAVDDEREVHRHRVEALVDQRLGEIERGDALGEAFVREQRLVHARTGGAERRVEHVLEAAQHVVGVEHRIARDLPQAVGAVAEDIGQRAGEHAHLAVERGHAPEAVRRGVDAVLFLDQLEAALGLRDERQRRERRQRLATAPPAPSPARRRRAGSRRSCAG